jgi:hypothetical protein
MKTLLAESPIIYVITGPLASGKSTYKKKLCAQLKTKVVSELQFGIDAAVANWWLPILIFAKQHNTKVVETHISFAGKDHIDFGAKLGVITKPPKNIKFTVLLPNAKTLLKRQLTRDKYSDLKGAEEELAWYSSVAKKLTAQIVV